MKMRFSPALLLGALLLLGAGCATRSISNSGYQGDSYFSRAGGTMGYRGELSEMDVLGVSTDATISDADIAAALADRSRPRLAPDSRVLLIQSGAELPDEPMMTAMGERYRVTAFSGRPTAKTENNGPAYARALRLAAARGGYDKIVCYWGVLESAEKNQATKAISWIPIVGYVVPDQEHLMRIRLKAVVVDVASGRWTFVNPPPASSSDYGSRLTRVETDQGLVAKLKQEGYRSLVQTLVASEG